MNGRNRFPNFHRKPAILALAVVVTLALAWQFWPQVPEENVSTQAEVVRVRRGDLVITASGEGTLEQVALPLGFSIPGTLIEIVQPGQTVAAGETLVKLDNQKAQIDLQAAELAWNELASPSALAALEFQILQTQAFAVDAQQSYDTTALGPDVKYYEHALALATDDYWQAVKALELARNSTSKKAAAMLPRLRMQVTAAEAALEEARLNLEWAITYQSDPSDVLLAEGQLQSTASLLAAQTGMLDVLTRDDAEHLSFEDISQPELSSLQSAWANLEQARQFLAASTLTAPFHGSVTQVNYETGEQINAFQPVLTLVADALFTVEFTLDESDIRLLSVGDSFAAVPVAYPNLELPGKITKIAPAISDAGQITVWGEIQPNSLVVKLLPGTNVEIFVTLAESKGALLLPLQAIHKDEKGRPYVNVMQADGSFKPVPVTLGLSDFTNAEILSGVKVDDVVSTGTVETK